MITPHTNPHDWLADILQQATSNIDKTYYNLPLYEQTPVYRERVYCYELYHQMRVLWPKQPFILNGEIDKSGHKFFDKRVIPDFLIHQPGTWDNLAVVEVKSASSLASGYIKDLETLHEFTESFGYTRAIYLIYGAPTSELLEKVLTSAQSIKNCEVWLHDEVGKACIPIHKKEV